MWIEIGNGHVILKKSGLKSVAKAKVARHFSFVKKIILIKKLRVFILTPPLPFRLLIPVDLCDIRFGLETNK